MINEQAIGNTQTGTNNNIKDKMPSKQNPRNRGHNRPKQNQNTKNPNNITRISISDPLINNLPFPELKLVQTLSNGGKREAGESGDEADTRCVAAGEGPVVDGEGEAHFLVVDRPAAANEVLGGSDDSDVDDQA